MAGDSHAQKHLSLSSVTHHAVPQCEPSDTIVPSGSKNCLPFVCDIYFILVHGLMPNQSPDATGVGVAGCSVTSGTLGVFILRGRWT